MQSTFDKHIGKLLCLHLFVRFMNFHSTFLSRKEGKQRLKWASNNTAEKRICWLRIDNECNQISLLCMYKINTHEVLV